MNIYDTQYGVTFADGLPVWQGDPVFSWVFPSSVKHYHTKATFNLYPVEKPVIEPPNPKTLKVDIPGADGEIDYTEALTGDVHYQNRKCTMKYKIPGNRQTWDGIYHGLLNAIHGKKLYLFLDEDPDGFYYGRFTVKEPEFENYSAYLEIDGDLDPYKYDLLSSTDAWLWDPFSFLTGVIRQYSQLSISSSTITIVGCPMPVAPDIYVHSKTGTLSVTYPTVDGTTATVTLSDGSNAENMPDFLIRDGEYTLTFSGTGVVSIAYRAGML